MERGPRGWHGTWKGWDRETEADRKQGKGPHRDRCRKGRVLCGRLRREGFKEVSRKEIGRLVAKEP